MSDRSRNLFMIGLFIFIVVVTFFFGRFLSVDDFTKDQNYLHITRTAADLYNPTTVGQAAVTLISTPIPYTADISPTALPPSSHTPTPTTTSSVQNTRCAFMWAHQDLPEIAKAAQKAFSATDTKIEVLRADAYGESCGTNFGAMTTDFYLNANVTNLNDDDELAQVVITAYNTLTALNVKLPAQLGYLDIQFTAKGATQHFRAFFPSIKSALDAGKDGESLIEIGGLQ